MFKRNKKIDFLAIGDITTDAFIRLKDAEVECDRDRKNCKLCVRFGDKIPYESVDIIRAVGNSPNAAVAASRLGLNAVVLASIGDDINGKECVESLKHDGVDTTYVRTEKGIPTNYHYVLWYGTDRTILIKHGAFHYSFPKLASAPAWIYLSSLGENSLAYHAEIAHYLKEHPETKLAFQPGTFQMESGIEALKGIYERTEIFFCNVEEAQRILKTGENDVKILIRKIHDLGPNIVAISDGPNGAYASDGKDVWSVPIYPDIAPPLQRTGAGDAFSSTFTVALALGKTVPEALIWGPINSMHVVQYIGAQKGLLSREKLEEYLKNAPENYKPKKI